MTASAPGARDEAIRRSWARAPEPALQQSSSGGLPANVGVARTGTDRLPSLSEYRVCRSEKALHPRNQPVVDLTTTPLASHEAAIPQAGEVRRDVRLAETGRLDEVAHALLTLCKLLENLEPAAVGEPAKERQAEVGRCHDPQSISGRTYKSILRSGDEPDRSRSRRTHETSVGFGAARQYGWRVNNERRLLAVHRVRQ
jgi:hypothetical protein